MNIKNYIPDPDDLAKIKELIVTYNASALLVIADGEVILSIERDSESDKWFTSQRKDQYVIRFLNDSKI